MQTVLTSIAVAKLKPKARRYEVRDARSSLRLIVFPSGKKSWVARFRRPDGRSAKLTLGPLNTVGETEGAPVIGAPLTLAAARKLAAEVDLARASGQDPAADHKAAKHRRRASAIEHAESSFAACAQRFIEEYASRKTRKWKVTARLLGLDPDGALRPKGLAERWAMKPVGEIGGNDIHGVVVETRKRGVPGMRRLREGVTEQQARYMFAVLSKLFAWLVAQRVLNVNPCTGVDRPKPSAPRDRVLSDREIRALWSACADAGPWGDAVKVLLITGQRLREVVRMHRDELNGSVWTLPAARTKNKREHTVPLPLLARQIIAGGRAPYVFSVTGEQPVSGWGHEAKRRFDARMPGVAPWRFHDLRRVAVSGMARAGADLHVIERAINHVSGSFGGVVGIYQRQRYADEVARALQAWENLLVSIVGGGADNVVPLRG